MTTEAEARIIGMMKEHKDTGSGKAVRAVFDALNEAGMGFDKEAEGGKSGPIGVLGLGNIAALGKVLNDRDATIRICHAIYYGEVQ